MMNDDPIDEFSADYLVPQCHRDGFRVMRGNMRCGIISSYMLLSGDPRVAWEVSLPIISGCVHD